MLNLFLGCTLSESKDLSLIVNLKEYNTYITSWYFQIFGYHISTYFNPRIAANEEIKEK